MIQSCAIVEQVVGVEKIAAEEIVVEAEAEETDLTEIVAELVVVRIVADLVVGQTGSGAVKSHSEVELVVVQIVSAAEVPAE